MSLPDCPLCKQNVALFKCPVCGATAHIDVKNKTITLHAPPLDPKTLRKGMQVSTCFPSHFDCQLAKPITEIDLSKLVKVEVKK